MIFMVLPAEAKLYHATSKAIANRIAKNGFSIKKMNPDARFGSGIYASKKPSTALKEKPNSDSVIALKESRMLNKNKIDTTKLSNEQIKLISRDSDLRGNIHKGVIGPKLGNKLGQYASKKGKVVEYKSAKDANNNIFVPKNVYQKHPKIIKPENIQGVR